MTASLGCGLDCMQAPSVMTALLRRQTLPFPVLTNYCDTAVLLSTMQLTLDCWTWAGLVCSSTTVVIGLRCFDVWAGLWPGLPPAGHAAKHTTHVHQLTWFSWH